MEPKYIMVSSTYMNGDKTRSVYGIALVNDSDCDTVILRCYYDLTPDASKAEELVSSCNRYKVEPIHLEDIVEDFLR